MGEGESGHSVYRKQMERTAEGMMVQLAESSDGDPRLVEVRQRSDKETNSRWRQWVGATR